MENELVGTELYLAPEVIDNADPSFASDLWALGVIIF
jgi:serine/threonine protein kinase